MERRKLTKREITREAKSIVATDGPDNCLEFGSEILARYDHHRTLEASTYAALQEALVKQARRVLKFLDLI